MKEKWQDFVWKVQDKWDSFIADKRKTHIAALFLGIAVGVGLRSL